MELRKKSIWKNEMGKRIVDQFVVDEDYNVPDAKEDVKRIVLSEGIVRIEEVKAIENYVRVMGKVQFRILYETEGIEPQKCTLEGKLPFEELVYTNEDKETMFVVRDCKVDFVASMIHSRKLNMKAMVELELSSEKMVEVEITTDVSEEVPLYKKQGEVNLLKLHTSKKDTYRIKEELALPGTKETIGTLLWSDVSSRKMDTKLVEDALLIEGELLVFCFYESPDGKLDWLEQMVPYEGKIECPGAQANMYHYVNSNLGDMTVDIRPDEDGEMRCIGVESTQEMKVAVYEEESMELLEDVYSLQTQCITHVEKVVCEEPVLQNHSKCKVTEKLTLPELQNDILQICHSNGMVQIEHMETTNEGILVEGVLHIHFLYVKASDALPFDVWEGMIPFSHIIACAGTGQNTKYDIASALEQLSISLLGGTGVEVKAILAFQCFLRKEREIATITKIDTQPLCLEEIEKSPGIIGYIVKEGDDLWSLAKRYHTTMEDIQMANEMQDESLKTGDRILIFKGNMSIL